MRMNKLIGFLKADTQRPVGSVCYATGLGLLFTLAFSYCLGSLSMLAGAAMSPFNLPAAFLLTETILFFYCSRRCFLWSALLNLSIIALSILFAGYIVDFSSDGNWYHQEIINALDKGWNCYRERTFSYELSLWALHYAKAFELISASIVSLTGRMETGKAVNFIIFFSTAFICWNLFGILKQDCSRLKKLVFISLLICNPVVICQLPTYYIDFTIYFYILLSLAFTTGIYKDYHVGLNGLGLALTVVLAVGTKFNAFFMEGVTILAILGWLLIKKQNRIFNKIFLLASISAVVGACIFSFHPYITNWMYAGHPLHPLLGENNIDIMTHNTPVELLDNNRFVNFFKSYLTDLGVIQFPIYDTRVGGFGHLSFLLFPFALLCIVYNVFAGKKEYVIGYIALIALASCFFFEQSWWARYNTQLWLIVPLGYLSLIECRKKPAVIVAWILTGISVLDISGCLISDILKSGRQTAYRHEIYKCFAGKTVNLANSLPHWIRILEENGIKCNPVDIYDIPAEKRLHYQWPESETSPAQVYILLIIEVEPDDKKQIMENFEKNDILLYWEKRKTFIHG